MSSFWRFTLLGLFGAAGIGLALCVALSSNSAADSSAIDAASSTVRQLAPVDAAAPIAPPRGPTWLHTEQAPPQATARNDAHSIQAQVEQIAPPIGQQSSFGNSPLEQNLLLAQSAPAGVSSQTAKPTSQQSTQAEAMDQLRQQLQRVLQNSSTTAVTSDNPTRIDTGSNFKGRSQVSNVGNSELPMGNPGVTPPKSIPRITRIPGEGDNNLSIHIQDSDLRDVLQLLSEQGGLNILPSPAVQGKVSASLSGVDIDTALAAILRSTGYVAKHEGKFIYVGKPKDFKAMDQSQDHIGTRVYHLNYVRASDINSLVTPLLTPEIGTISVTAPANEGIAADDSKAGGDQFAGGDSVLVHDFVAVLDQIEEVIAEIDRRPAQVAIEAMILRVTLKDTNSFGIDFELLRQNPDLRLATGSPLPNVGNLDFKDGGLKFAFLNGSTNAFISALETIGDTNVIASPHLMVVDKARAEVLIGKQLGYVNTTITETSTAQNVQFLEVGTQLRLRPFISSDGLVRMEVHPELSDGSVEVREGLTLPQKETTQVTTNIVVPDGCTVIIGGLLQDSLKTDGNQVPFFGSLPGIGFLFRHKTETTEKEEIVVLITPHIICDATACCEGDKAAAEFHRRQAVYADQMSPLGKRYLGRKYYRLAQTAWAKGDQPTALRFADLAVHFDPESRAAISLRTDIWNGNLTGDHTLLHPDVMAPMIGSQIEEIPPEYGPQGQLPKGLPHEMQSPLPSPEQVPPGPPIPMDAQSTPDNAAIKVSDMSAGDHGAANSSVQAPKQLPMVPSAAPVPIDKGSAVKTTSAYESNDGSHEYTAEPALLPPPPSAALPIIPTKPLERMASATPATAAGAMRQSVPVATPASGLSAPSTSSSASHESSKATLNAASMQPATVNPVPKMKSPSKSLDDDQLPAWMVDGLMNTERSSSSPSPAVNTSVLSPPQK